MENGSPSKLKSALNFGAVIGLCLVIITILTYLFELYEAKWIQLLNYAILIGGIAKGIKDYRDKQLGGNISYGSALGYGALLALSASVVVSFVNYIYLKFIDDGLIMYSLEAAEMAMYDAGMEDEQIEMAMQMQSKMFSPGGIAIIGVFATTIFGFIISLIASIFLKKEANPFEEE